MRVLMSSIVLLTIAGSAVSAQSLAALAKKEEERRKTVKSGKVYTNGDLKRENAPTPPTPAPTNASSSTPTTPQAPSTQVPAINVPVGKGEAEVKDEAYWRARITAARSALERSRIFADALQSRINALTTDFVNRDDPAQRAQIELEKQRAVAEIERVKKEIADQTKAISDIEEEARKAGVPPGWLR